jgi:hypothetical protein
MKCKYISEKGKKCSANAMNESEYCFFHDPDGEYKKQRKDAQSKGGKANLVTVKTPLPPITISEAKDVVGLLEDTINKVRAGELDVKVGNCIGVLSGQLIKALELANVTSRVEAIERVILEKKTTIS